MKFRFKNRSDPHLFRGTLMRLTGSPVLRYKGLTAA